MWHKSPWPRGIKAREFRFRATRSWIEVIVCSLEENVALHWESSKAMYCESEQTIGRVWPRSLSGSNAVTGLEYPMMEGLPERQTSARLWPRIYQNPQSDIGGGSSAKMKDLAISCEGGTAEKGNSPMTKLGYPIIMIPYSRIFLSRTPCRRYGLHSSNPQLSLRENIVSFGSALPVKVEDKRGMRA